MLNRVLVFFCFCLSDRKYVRFLFYNLRYAPNYMYPGRIYPNYLSGTGYLMSTDVVPKLYNAALETPIFHLEDVYITGKLKSLVCTYFSSISV